MMRDSMCTIQTYEWPCIGEILRQMAYEQEKNLCPVNPKLPEPVHTAAKF